MNNENEQLLLNLDEWVIIFYNKRRIYIFINLNLYIFLNIFLVFEASLCWFFFFICKYRNHD